MLPVFPEGAAVALDRHRADQGRCKRTSKRRARARCRLNHRVRGLTETSQLQFGLSGVQFRDCKIPEANSLGWDGSLESQPDLAFVETPSPWSN